MKKIEYIKPEIVVSAIFAESLLDTTSLATDNKNELSEESDFLGNEGGSIWDED